MCGIAGILLAGPSTRASDFIGDAMVAGMLRGVDSTGVMQMAHTGAVYTHKDAVDGALFREDKTTRQFIKDSNTCPITVIHTRAATHGIITTANAHPFISKDSNGAAVVGVHNGSLTNWKGKEGAAQYQVDSEWALSRIALRGADAFKEIDGPYCFVWLVDKEKNKVHMARNHQRPMHLLFSKDRKAMMFASEAGMLSWLATRNGFTCEDNMLSLSPERLYEFDTTGPTVKYTSTPLPAKPVTVWKGGTYVTQPASASNVTPIRPAAATRFIDNVKAAAQGKLAMITPVTKPDKLQRQVDKAVSAIIGEEGVVAQREDDAPFLEEAGEPVPLTWFSERLTSNSERKMAVDTGFFGEMHWFSGVVYDDTVGELIGEVEIWSKKNGKQTYTGIVRGISQPRAHSQFIDNAFKGMKEGGFAVITGAKADDQLGTVFIMSELNMIGKDALDHKRKRMN